jgi:hypothetical protein
MLDDAAAAETERVTFRCHSTGHAVALRIV